jgi:hypothetical protein
LALHLALGSVCPAGAAETAELLMARGLQAEQGSADPAAAVALYEQALSLADSNRTDLVARLLYRLGACERRRGRTPEARGAWGRLTALRPASDPWALRARRELQELTGEEARVSVAGRVVGLEGAPVAQAWVLAGDWDLAPPLLTGDDGRFRAERAAGLDARRGQRFCALYAEHPERPLAAIAVARFPGGPTAELDVPLRPLRDVEGRVLDAAGQPVAGATVAVTAAEATDAPVLPYGRLMAPLRSGPDGRFHARLVSGWRLVFGAQSPGYRLLREGLVEAGSEPARAVEIRLELTGRQSLQGVVTDEDGRPLHARVAATAYGTNTAAELAVAWTDANGAYRLDFLPERLVRVKAESSDLFADRWLGGFVPDGERVDFVLSAAPPLGTVATEGRPAPELEVTSLPGTPLRLAHLRGEIVVLYFWNRAEDPAPPMELDAWRKLYGPAGLTVVCVHDHSARLEDLQRVRDRVRPGLLYAVDRYAPAAEARANHSATAARYGAGPGVAALVDREGVLRLRGPLHSLDVVRRFDSAIRELAGAGDGRPDRAEVAVLRAGQPAPAWSLAQWVRSDPALGAAGRLDTLRGKVVVLHFASAYADALARRGPPEGASSLDALARRYGARGVVSVWVLPSADSMLLTQPAAAPLPSEVPVALDRDGRTYAAFGVREPSVNVVVDADGTIAVPACSDAQVFQVVKTLLRDRF